jgi:hypothetical protein
MTSTGMVGELFHFWEDTEKKKTERVAGDGCGEASLCTVSQKRDT